MDSIFGLIDNLDFLLDSKFKLYFSNKIKVAASLSDDSGIVSIVNETYEEIAHHAEFVLVTNYDIENKTIYVTDQPCFKEELIRINDIKENNFDGLCLKTNYNNFKKFKISILDDGNYREVSTTNWDKGKVDFKINYGYITRTRRYKEDIFIIDKLYMDKWIPVEEIEYLSNNLIYRRFGCSVTLAHMMPKNIFYTQDEEKKNFYNGGKKYLQDRGVDSHFVNNDLLEKISHKVKITEKMSVKELKCFKNELTGLKHLLGYYNRY